jgi:hypothetical protein
MKNSINLVLVILLFVVLGCTCPNMQELSKKIDNAAATPVPVSTTPANNSTSSTPGKGNSNSSSTTSALTMDKYNQIKEGMSYTEVVALLGSEGTETLSSGSGKYKVTSYKWEGDNFEFITVIFMGDKMTQKVQANLK